MSDVALITDPLQKLSSNTSLGSVVQIYLHFLDRTLVLTASCIVKQTNISSRTLRGRLLIMSEVEPPISLRFWVDTKPPVSIRLLSFLTNQNVSSPCTFGCCYFAWHKGEYNNKHPLSYLLLAIYCASLHIERITNLQLKPCIVKFPIIYPQEY